MFEIKGKVLVKESGVGIPDLQIVVYDLDNPPNAPNERVELFNQLQDQEPFFWQHIHGNRLGSVLTDEKGNFSLPFDEADFTPGELVKRPDLILFVVAPEDSQQDNTLGGLFVAKPPKQRILHYSYDPVVNSGKMESYIFRLSTALLDKFSIRYPNSPTAVSSTETKVSQLTKILDQSEEYENEVSDLLKKKSTKRFKKMENVHNLVKKATRKFSLSKHPEEFRKSLRYYQPGEDLQEKQITLFKQNLAARKSNESKHTMVLHLRREQLDEDIFADLKIEGNTAVGTVKVEELYRYLAEKVIGAGLARDQPVLDTSFRQISAAKTVAEVMGEGGSGMAPANGQNHTEGGER